ncbi:O-antigen ligase [Parelusimicrobium proximum]|uniref:O-antigen ligase family protein n=1 Tax=Parelusimicrobium proximum TaxID=3228953 RepID=UPI003D1840FA
MAKFKAKTIKKETEVKEKSDFFSTAAAYVSGFAALLISISFTVRTYDTAAYKIALFYTAFIMLLALWTSKKIMSAKKISKEKLLYIMPVLAYVLWNTVSYFYNPAKLANIEEFARLIMAGLTPLFIFTLIGKKDIRIINKFLTITVSLCLAYGAVQIINNYLIKGFDIMPWAGFFGRRIFAMQANPNFFADFLLFMSFFLLAQAVKTKEKKYFILLILSAAELFFTESKGAWLALGGSAVVFVLFGQHFSLFSKDKKVNNIVKAAAFAALACSVLFTVVYSFKRAQSVSFRLATWRGVWSMAMESPVLGSGAASFRSVYPSFKRAEIFYIEGIHNAETQHAENEFLEVFATTGIIGLALMLSMICYLLVISYRKMKEFTYDASLSPPALAYDLAGYVFAFIAILAHNMFDVSLRFVSTGYFYALFTGLILVLCYPSDAEDTLKEPAAPSASFKVLSFVSMAFTLALVCLCAKYFYEIPGLLIENGTAGRLMLMLYTWAVFIFVCAGFLYVMRKLVYTCRNVYVCVFAVLSACLFVLAFQPMRGDMYLNIASYYANRSNYPAAVQYYTKSLGANPFVSSIYRFRGAVISGITDTSKTYKPKFGDKKGEMKNNYERVIRDFKHAARLNYNEPLLHFNMAEHYLNYADYLKSINAPAREINEYLAKSAEEAQYYLLLDPVYDQTYFLLAQIEYNRGNFEKSKEYIDAYLRGPAGVENEEYLSKHRTNPRALNVLKQIEKALL